MQLIWRETLIPTHEPIAEYTSPVFFEDFRIPRTQAIGLSDLEFTNIPDKKALRLMSRTSILLSSAMLRAQSVIAQLLEADPFRVATYCAIDNGSEHYGCVQGLLNVPKHEWASQYRKLRSPKQYLKQLPNLAPAQAGIFLGLVGPLNVYHSSRWGGHHAIEQLRADMKANRIDAGVVVSANSFEDPLLTYRNRLDAGPEKTLREGAGVLVFRRGKDAGDDNRDDSRGFGEFGSEYSYGIATSVIEYAQKGAQHDA